VIKGKDEKGREKGKKRGEGKLQNIERTVAYVVVGKIKGEKKTIYLRERIKDPRFRNGWKKYANLRSGWSTF